MAKISEIFVGATYGRLTISKIVVGPVKYRRKTGETLVECSCSCGGFWKGHPWALGKNVRSCGCLRPDSIAKKGGLSRKNKRLYWIWCDMHRRCANKESKGYGLKGITVCEEWHDLRNFWDWAVSNGYKDDLTIDRINNDGNYEPGNCRWATRSVQNKNRNFIQDGKNNNAVKFTEDQVRTVRRLRASGVTVKEIARRMGLGDRQVGGLLARKSWKGIE